MSQESTAPKQKVRREQHPLWNWVGFLPFFLFIFLFLVLPSLNLFTGAFTNQQGEFTLENLNILSNPFTRKSYIVSLQVSAITAVAGGLFGFFVAYSITHGGAPRWMRSMISTFSGLAANFGGVPLAFSFIATLGQLGFVTVILKGICFNGADGIEVCPFNPYDHGFSLYSLWGIVLAYIYFQFPLMIITITPALEGLRNEWREAATNMGATSFQYWRDVALPVLLPSILGAMLLLFGNAFGAYATARALTGGSIYLVPIAVGQQIRGDVLGNPHQGYALAFGMVVVMSVAIAAYGLLQRRASRWIRS